LLLSYFDSSFEFKFFLEADLVFEYGSNSLKENPLLVLGDLLACILFELLLFFNGGPYSVVVGEKHAGSL
jgi:hypothetical protein